jgi:hypothetical protein
MVPESLTSPLRDRIRVNDDQMTRPTWPEGPQCHPEGAVNIVEKRAWPFALKCAYLLAQSKVLCQERRTGKK